MTDTKVGYRGGYEQKEREGEMNKQKIEEYVDLIDETIQLEEQEEHREDTEEYRQSEIRKFLFGEIKEIIERKRKQKSTANLMISEDSIKEIMSLATSGFTHEATIRGIRKLLRRRADKPRVSREEIISLVNDIQNCGTPRPCGSCIDSVIALFNVSGVRVLGK